MSSIDSYINTKTHITLKNTVKLVLKATSTVGSFSRQVIAAVLIPDDEGFISISQDRSIRVWLKRDSGRYWPSVCEYLSVNPTCLLYCKEKRNLFVALENGSILGYILADDLNSISATNTYGGHIAQVTDISLNIPRQILLSTGEDKRLSWNRLDNGYMLGSVLLSSITNCICIDCATGCVFVGEESGKIQFINIDQYKSNEPLKSTELCRHKASVIKLVWDDDNSRLISYSADKKVMVWEIGIQNGICYELSGPESQLTGVGLVKVPVGVISCHANGNVIFWNMNVHREQPLPWQDSDKCQRCNIHFFWNMKEMWQKKKIGIRQHHCRRCGRALCNDCSKFSTVLPIFGFEVPVRVCADCNSSVDHEQKSSLASFVDINNSVSYMDYDTATNRLLTIGKDRTITVWEAAYKNTEES